MLHVLVDECKKYELIYVFNKAPGSAFASSPWRNFSFVRVVKVELKQPSDADRPLLLSCLFIRILTRLLEVSDDPQVIAVAAHDIGEYVRHYPRGKR